MKRPLNTTELKAQFKADIAAGRLTLGQATRRMRQILGMTQREYADKVVGITLRILIDIEKDRGNPTLETLNKIARPFNLRVGFGLPPLPERPEPDRG